MKKYSFLKIVCILSVSFSSLARASDRFFCIGSSFSNDLKQRQNFSLEVLNEKNDLGQNSYSAYFTISAYRADGGLTSNKRYRVGSDLSCNFGPELNQLRCENKSFSYTVLSFAQADSSDRGPRIQGYFMNTKLTSPEIKKMLMSKSDTQQIDPRSVIIGYQGSLDKSTLYEFDFPESSCLK